MRETAHRVLGPDAGPDALPPVGKELDTLISTLRGHLQLLMPEVEQAAGWLPENSPTRHSALTCVGEARGKLRAPELSFARLAGSVMYARRLARVLVALCEHYEIVSAGVAETPSQTAFVRLADHCLTCPTCQARDDQGARLGLPCETHDRLNDEYREALRLARADRRHAEASA
ncbi:DUF6415 family natural product biosynthesis protein [Streptomyces sp. 378]|uniref:DUF6415 family natural product biosynthesis protein n=1 Tax=Streptomyces sp. 378 TaxID=3049412 RepID=UPI0024C368AA|nr:DUF6415 family natural product biosynthesis protein [Streptomyces sp. 378]MDK1344181.1 DUF6415 family natural product biosynthesis protein [Streptomyces sp. 378]